MQTVSGPLPSGGSGTRGSLQAFHPLARVPSPLGDVAKLQLASIGPSRWRSPHSLTNGWVLCRPPPRRLRPRSVHATEGTPLALASGVGWPRFRSPACCAPLFARRGPRPSQSRRRPRSPAMVLPPLPRLTPPRLCTTRGLRPHPPGARLPARSGAASVRRYPLRASTGLVLGRTSCAQIALAPCWLAILFSPASPRRLPRLWRSCLPSSPPCCRGAPGATPHG